MIKSIVSGFGRALGRFLFYALIGLLIYLIFDNWKVNALVNTQDIVEVNINYNINRNNYTFKLQNPNIFVYDNQYYSDLRVGGSLYLLGYWEQPLSGDDYVTRNINWYFPSSCSSSEMLNYTMNIYFYCQGSYCPGSYFTNISSGTNTCSGNWLQGGDNPIYQLNCNAPAGSLPLGSLYFSSKYIGNLNYRVGIQKNFSYTCDVNSQAIIENQNVNTDRTIQAITDLNGNVTIINNSISEVNSTLTDTSTLETGDISDLTSNSLGDDIIGSTLFSDMILLAPQLLESLLINENVCTHYSFGELYGTELRLPCIEPQNYLGIALWTVVDLMFCVALLFPFIRWVAQTLYNIMGLESLNPDTYFGFSDSISRSH